MHRLARTRRSFRLNAIIVGLAFVGGLTTACREPLFPRDENRTQFDRYDLSRNQFEPQFIEDEFGRREPNLRGRLEPKD